MTEKEVLLLTKKNARILSIGDGTYVMYTWDPETAHRGKDTFDNYEAASKEAAKFMGFQQDDSESVQ